MMICRKLQKNALQMIVAQYEQQVALGGGCFEGSIKDWDMLTKINLLKNKYLWILEKFVILPLTFELMWG
jgi:hypothetical protein